MTAEKREWETKARVPRKEEERKETPRVLNLRENTITIDRYTIVNEQTEIRELGQETNTSNTQIKGQACETNRSSVTQVLFFSNVVLTGNLIRTLNRISRARGTAAHAHFSRLFRALMSIVNITSNDGFISAQ